MPSYRKRRRPRPFPYEQSDELPSNSDRDEAGNIEEDGKDKKQKLEEKEREIWDAFKEEHFEAIEQLPLSLHRLFTLMRELDEQAHSHNSELLPTIEKYVLLRRSMVSRSDPESHHKPFSSDMPNNMYIDTIHAGGDGSSVPHLAPSGTEMNPPTLSDLSPRLSRSTPPSERQPTPAMATAESMSTPRLSPMSVPPERIKPPQTTRQVLSRVAWLSEEVLRASEEKVNLAQAAFDSVDRHIRLLDQAIKEQEMSLSLGIRPGTHPAPIILPDLSVPRWGRSTGHAHSPTPSLSGDGDTGEIRIDGHVGDEEGGPTLGIVSSGAPGEVQGPSNRKKGGKRGRGKWSKKKPEKEVVMQQSSHPRRGSAIGTRSLKLTVPPLASVAAAAPPDEVPPNPSEPRYCYCNQVSFGEMIACDNRKCEREWFHLGCAGLAEAPKGRAKWFCRDCKENMELPGRRGRL